MHRFVTLFLALLSFLALGVNAQITGVKLYGANDVLYAHCPGGMFAVTLIDQKCNPCAISINKSTFTVDIKCGYDDRAAQCCKARVQLNVADDR